MGEAAEIGRESNQTKLAILHSNLSLQRVISHGSFGSGWDEVYNHVFLAQSMAGVKGLH